MDNTGLKSYLFVIDSSTMSLTVAISHIDKDDTIENWYTILPDAAILVSRLPVYDLHGRLKALLPGQRYIVTRLDGAQKNGWLPKDTWASINKPVSVFGDD
jgi:hypothetical protein